MLRAASVPRQRLIAAVETVAEWVASEYFRGDQLLRARPSFALELRDDALREHLAEIDRFATALATDAEMPAAREYGAFVTTLVAGAAAWFDRREAGRAASVSAVERMIADAHGD